MFNILLLCLSMVCGTGRSLFTKAAGQNGNKNIYIFNNLLLSVFTLITVLILSIGNNISISWYTVSLAAGYAASAFAGQIAYITLFDSCGVSLGSLFYSCGFLIPIFAGVFFWQESITILQIIGIGILLIGLLLATFPKGAKISPKNLILSLICLLGSGMCGVFQKIHQTSQYRSELSAFVVFSFLIMATGSLIVFLIFKNKNANLKSVDRKKILMISGAGLANGVINKSNLYLTGVLPTVIFFPVYNVGVIICTCLAALLFFRERLKRWQYIGITIAIAAMLLINKIITI